MRENIDQIKAKYPDVIGYCVASKRVEGQDDRVPSICLFVKKKQEPEALSPGQMLPKFIAGVPTDVREGKFTPASTVRGGDRVAPFNLPDKKGVMGIVIDKFGTNMLLTCAHVLQGPGMPPPNDLQKPIDAVSKAKVIGRSVPNDPNEFFAFWARNHVLDAALMSPKLTNTNVPGVKPPNADFPAPIKFGVVSHLDLNKVVWKLGRRNPNATNGYGFGTIMSVNFNHPLTNGEEVADHILVLPQTSKPFVHPAGGDSGAVVVKDNEVIGIIRAAGEMGEAIVCKIDHAQSVLGIDFAS